MDLEAHVWIPNHPQLEWYPGRVKTRTKTSVIAVDSNDNEFEIPFESARFFKPESLIPISDLLALDEFSEALLLHTIRTRYSMGQIYTVIGNSITVSVNPYKFVPLYTDDIKTQYLRMPAYEIQNAEPHLYRTAAIVYQNMRMSSKGQSILITGESGAGKTESTKIILNYLTSHSGEKGLEERILFTNPVLEAFGNAQTVRNDNSSRFGKYIELYFEDKIKGAQIESYLLEKSRIVKQSINERNYHIFYQLFFSQNKSLLEELEFNISDKYVYLNLDYGNIEARKADDAIKFKETVKSLMGIGFSIDFVQDILRAIAGLLHLGNIVIEGDNHSSKISKSCPHLDICCKLLGINHYNLQSLICYKNFIDPGTKQTLTRNLPLNFALVSRDTLAKTIYSEIFNWLVRSINDSLFGQLAENKDRQNIVGILDIFGFEIFDENSFEQMCINYANEKLQAHFNEHIFTFEQKLYEEENIAWQRIDYQNNQKIMALFEEVPHSIFSFLDEECLYTSSSDNTFLERMRVNLQRNDCFIVRKPKSKKECFGIKHFAGEVFYTIDNFLEKNRNAANREMNEILSHSPNEVVSTIFRLKLKSESVISKQVLSISKQFSTQLNGLLAKLDESHILYIRCIKPNTQKQPDNFESKEVVSQLKAAGILQVVKIRKSGFPYRATYKQFCSAYHHLFTLLGIPHGDHSAFLQFVYEKIFKLLFVFANSNNKANRETVTFNNLTIKSDELSRLAKMIPRTEVGLPFEDMIQYGKSKIFSKEIIKQVLDILYEKSIYRFVQKIQQAFRNYSLRRKHETLNKFVFSCLSRLRVQKGILEEIHWIRRKYAAVNKIGREYKYYKARQRTQAIMRNLMEIEHREQREAKMRVLELARQRAKLALQELAALEAELGVEDSATKQINELHNEKRPPSVVSEANSDLQDAVRITFSNNNEVSSPEFAKNQVECVSETDIQNKNYLNFRKLNGTNSNKGNGVLRVYNTNEVYEEIDFGEANPDKKQKTESTFNNYSLSSDKFVLNDPSEKRYSVQRFEYFCRQSFDQKEPLKENFFNADQGHSFPATFNNSLTQTDFDLHDKERELEETKMRVKDLERTVEFLRAEMSLGQISQRPSVAEDSEIPQRRQTMDLLNQTIQVIKNSTVTLKIHVDELHKNFHDSDEQMNGQASLNKPESDVLHRLRPVLSSFNEHLKSLFAVTKLLSEQLTIRDKKHIYHSFENKSVRLPASSDFSDTDYISKKKLDLYQSIMESLLVLLKWKTIENQLRELANQTQDMAKLKVVSENIRHLSDETDVIQSHLEEKLNQLFVLQQIEGTYKSEENGI